VPRANRFGTTTLDGLEIVPALSTLFPFIGAVLILALIPGPDLLLLVSRGVGHGWRVALLTALGFTTAGLIQLPLLAVGLASIVRHSPTAFALLKYAGAFYLIWRGVQLMRSRRILTLQTNSSTSPWIALRDGMVASLTNPKGLVFLLAFLPQFVDPSRGHVTLQLLVLGLVMKVTALLVEASIALASGAVGSWLGKHPRFVQWQHRGSGVILILLGLRLLTMREARAR
jgi:threonine/homoserine/homoserine lactone efflux protein